MITELEFKSLASQGYNRIPLVTEAFADLETPLSLYLKLAHAQGDGKYSFLLESVVGGERFGRYSFIGLPARSFLRASGFGAAAKTEVVTDGTVVDVCIGEGNEPKLVITDLLPHLGAEQSKKPLGEAIPGETLNILLGSRPLGDDEDSDRVKMQVLKRLYDKYGITEADFASAELEAVPAADPVDIGIDGSMIGSYGHDDRVCGYAALRALLELDAPAKTAVCVLADKEEIGSMGVTGMQSAVFETFLSDLCDSQSVPLKVCFENSFCLSADVTAAYDPNFADVFDKKNAAFLNHGVGLCKYTGARGKSGSSDAGAETVAYVRSLLDGAGVRWQICELGKVDAGGGGTVAQYMANRNIATLDAGVPVLSMHAPFEVVAKLDCYEMYRACKAIYEAR